MTLCLVAIVTCQGLECGLTRLGCSQIGTVAKINIKPVESAGGTRTWEPGVSHDCGRHELALFLSFLSFSSSRALTR